MIEKAINIVLAVCALGIVARFVTAQPGSYIEQVTITDTIYQFDTLWLHTEPSKRTNPPHPTEVPQMEDEAVKNYLRRFTRLALDEAESYGILPSIKLGQAILESGAGSSRLATEGKNHFGLKHRSWDGDMAGEIKGIIYASDDCPDKCAFTSFKTDWAGWRAHSLVLSAERYKSVREADNYTKAAQALSEAGYAGDPHYWRKLVRVIEKYKLYVLDPR